MVPLIDSGRRRMPAWRGPMRGWAHSGFFLVIRGAGGMAAAAGRAVARARFVSPVASRMTLSDPESSTFPTSSCFCDHHPSRMICQSPGSSVASKVPMGLPFSSISSMGRPAAAGPTERHVLYLETTGDLLLGSALDVPGSDRGCDPRRHPDQPAQHDHENQRDREEDLRPAAFPFGWGHTRIC